MRRKDVADADAEKANSIARGELGDGRSRGLAGMVVKFGGAGSKPLPIGSEVFEASYRRSLCDAERVSCSH